jgi:hypothetical protein
MLEGQARYRPSTRCLHDLAELASLTLSNERAGRRPCRATIEVDGEMWWTSTQAHQVLTHGAPDHVEVMVSRVSG